MSADNAFIHSRTGREACVLHLSEVSSDKMLGCSVLSDCAHYHPNLHQLTFKMNITMLKIH